MGFLKKYTQIIVCHINETPTDFLRTSRRTIFPRAEFPAEPFVPLSTVPITQRDSPKISQDRTRWKGKQREVYVRYARDCGELSQSGERSRKICTGREPSVTSGLPAVWPSPGTSSSTDPGNCGTWKHRDARDYFQFECLSDCTSCFAFERS